MTLPSKTVFLNNLDLRNVSFKKRNLQGANFSGSDIRGCDFSYSILQNACFDRVTAGREPMKLFWLLLVAIATAIASFHAYSQMLFGIVGITSEDPAWIYVYPLHISLGLAGLEGVVKSFSTRQTIVSTISGAASGALLGFFYLGSATDNNPQMASTGAIMGAIFVSILFLLGKNKRIIIAIAAAASIANYGLSFLFVAKASANLSTHHFAIGLFWAILSLLAIVATFLSLKSLFEQINIFSTTSFRGADLTNANFEGARLGKTDFTNTILWDKE